VNLEQGICFSLAMYAVFAEYRLPKSKETLVTKSVVRSRVRFQIVAGRDLRLLKILFS